jgi:hypothetical protein
VLLHIDKKKKEQQLNIMVLSDTEEELQSLQNKQIDDVNESDDVVL